MPPAPDSSPTAWTKLGKEGPLGVAVRVGGAVEPYDAGGGLTLPSSPRPLFDGSGFAAEAGEFLSAHPDVEKVELLFPDINGVLRGKWIPARDLARLGNGHVRMPISTYALDIWGEDVPAAGLALTRGDPDGIAHPAPGTLARVPWAARPTAQVLMSISPAGAARARCAFDPRARLADIVDRFAERGLTPVVATELEFFLYQPDTPASGPPVPPSGTPDGQVATTSQLYDLEIMTGLQPVLDDIHEACLRQGIPAVTTVAEAGPGQFEINLAHVPDALEAADHAALFKRVVRHTARRHGLEATFMAKPHANQAGSGMHVHVSLLDRAGENVFSGHGEDLAMPLRGGIAGLLATMGDLMAVFAPHANSYRRFQRDVYVPLTPNWGYDHRGAAVRVPASQGPAARLEHRVCGADVNPYLALTAILGGILLGPDVGSDPGPPAEGHVQPKPGQWLPVEWNAALDRFEQSAAAKRIFGDDFHRVYCACRRSEAAVFNAAITDLEYRTYLRRL